MSKIISKNPFLRILIPILVGIAIAFYFPKISIGIFLFSVGILFVLTPIVIPKTNRNIEFWGFFFLFMGFTVYNYSHHLRKSSFEFDNETQIYRGIVQDIPLKKKNSVQLSVKLINKSQSKVVLYAEDTWEVNYIEPGDEIIFKSKLQPFKNLGNPDDFDYKRYMQVKGFSASGYVSLENWYLGSSTFSIYTFSQQLRKRILFFFDNLQLGNLQKSLLSALIIGYKADLTEDVQNAFRVSGTAHVLAVSGMHVAIIYQILGSLLFFIRKNRKGNIAKYSTIILLLWLYAFITGFSVSVIRAAIMLTIYSIGKIIHRKGFTYNTLAAAASMILLVNPLSFFEVGFQLSFASVFAILYFKPKFDSLYSPSNKELKIVWNLFTLSLAAQFSVFPLTFYYFGTFPTYFFITNLLVVPLVQIITYACIPLFVFGGLAMSSLKWTAVLFKPIKYFFQFLINALYSIVHFFENLPFAQLSNYYLTVLQVILFFVLIFSLTRVIFDKKIRFLTLSALSFWLLLLTYTSKFFEHNENALWVLNRPGATELMYSVQNQTISPVLGTGVVPHPSKRILLLKKDIFKYKTTQNPLDIDILILTKYPAYSLKYLLEKVHPKCIVLDNSLPRRTRIRLAEQAVDMGIYLHDVTEKGAFSIKL